MSFPIRRAAFLAAGLAATLALAACTGQAPAPEPTEVDPDATLRVGLARSLRRRRLQRSCR
jgi:ABC-type phosphate/phosphonate transport system substrate-binding protein